MQRSRSDGWQLICEIALPALVFVAVEIGFRSYLAAIPNAPMPNLFPFPITTGKYLAYRDVAGDEKLDILLMGMSQMMRVSAKRLQERVTESSRRHVRVFNFAAPLQYTEFNRRLLKDILLGVKKPSLIVLGIIPTNLLYERSEAVVDRLIQTLPVFAAHAGTPAAYLERALLDWSGLIKYRETIQAKLAGRRANRIAAWEREARATDEVGDVTIALPPSRPVLGLTPWEKKSIPKLRNFRNQLETNPLFGRLTAFADLCRQNEVRLVVLNNAVHPLYLEMLPHGIDDYGEFVRQLRATAEDSGALFFDPAGGEPADPLLFFDTVHHNEAGSAWITDQLGRFLVENDTIH